VARSVESFTAEYRRRGHEVLVVAPEFRDSPRDETGVVRLPAIQNFNASDFSLVLPAFGGLAETLDTFQPEVVHSHHPFLLGMTALRVARVRGLPLVFTHHTFYEAYTPYVRDDAPGLKRFVAELATRYANLADHVFAPSRSVERTLRERGVRSSVSVVPTGVALERFAEGDGAAFRRRRGIPEAAYVVGHVGRLAPEKNLEFLSEALVDFLARESRAHVVVVGKGPSEREIRLILGREDLGGRLHMAGVLELPELADALRGMDVFAFTSQTETQGIVLTEAMAAGVPVVGVDGPGVREVIRDGRNGRLCKGRTPEEFADALHWVFHRSPEEHEELRRGARETAREFAISETAAKALERYEALLSSRPLAPPEEDQWERFNQWIRTEWDILRELAGAGRAAFSGPPRHG